MTAWIGSVIAAFVSGLSFGVLVCLVMNRRLAVGAKCSVCRSCLDRKEEVAAVFRTMKRWEFTDAEIMGVMDDTFRRKYAAIIRDARIAMENHAAEKKGRA